MQTVDSRVAEIGHLFHLVDFRVNIRVAEMLQADEQVGEFCHILIGFDSLDAQRVIHLDGLVHFLIGITPAKA